MWAFWFVLFASLPFVALWGLFLLAFRRGRRKRGALMFGAAFVAWVGAAIGLGNQGIVEQGWDGVLDMQRAEDAGFTDPDEWRRARPRIEAEQAAAARIAAEKAAAEKAEAERRAAEQAEAERTRKEAERLAAEQAEAQRKAAAEAEKLAQEKAEAERQAAADAARRKAGFHCLSAWDGSHTGVKSAIKGVMREPSSFEHIETRITPVNEDGNHVLTMTYRARNGFGGMNVSTALVTVRNDDCHFTVLTIE
jgi:hypothetical protein